MILKFRAWLKKEKKMFLSPSEIEHLGSWFDAHLPGSIANKENVILMQSTGLKDKNGKEIFESDIVKFYDIPNPKKNELEFFHLCIIGKHKFLPIYKGAPLDLEGWESGQLEVIGNIHQNPELLEVR